MTGVRRLVRAAILRSLAYRRMFTFRSAVKLEAAGHPAAINNRQRAGALEALSQQRARLLAQLALDRERGRRRKSQITFAVAD